MSSKIYTCTTCGFEQNEPGLCPDCGLNLEEVCTSCGNPKSECQCEISSEEKQE